MARRVFDAIVEARAQQDNEAFHLLVLEELLRLRGDNQGLVAPQGAAQADGGPVSAVVLDPGGGSSSVADVLRQIGHDERFHKTESLAAIGQQRY